MPFLYNSIMLLMLCACPVWVFASDPWASDSDISQHVTHLLWVVDSETGIGVPQASVAIGPGSKCLGQASSADAVWNKHYVTGSSGRVVTEPLQQNFSCRVMANGHQLNVVSVGSGACPPAGPAWMNAKEACVVSIAVGSGEPRTEDDPNYWNNTDEPTRFSGYIEDSKTGELISDVTIRTLVSGLMTRSDANGFYSIDVPASYRKNKTLPTATETLIFSKPGYQALKFERLILRPGISGYDIVLTRGTGTLIRKNGGSGRDEVYIEGSRGDETSRGEITLLDIRPSTVTNGWITITQPGAKAVVIGRNLKSVNIYFYPTGTGSGLMPPGKIGPMKRVESSPKGDTWEIELPDLMTTNFWAVGIDLHGHSVKSMDLGGVKWNVTPH